jgi:hypothetical protein
MVNFTQLNQSGICRIGANGGRHRQPSSFANVHEANVREANVREQFDEPGPDSSSECCQLTELPARRSAMP